MTRSTQNFLLILVGAAVLWITFGSGEYVNYVKPGFRYLLVPAGAALILLGAAGLRREWRAEDTGNAGSAGSVDAAHDDKHEGGHDGGHDDAHEHGHDHSRGPRVAWLLCLPVLIIFAVAPPALGSFTAARDTGRPAPPPAPPEDGYGPLPRTGEPIAMTMGEYIGRSFLEQTGRAATLRDVPVRLTGFVTPLEGSDWQVTRLSMACCAGDAMPFSVVVHDRPQPPEGAWVQVVGTWMPPEGKAQTGVHDLHGAAVRRIPQPENPYE
ncbi:TIGR03943 family putative permease subunit [Actinomadura sp. LOL_016]|uniref:TIGR03943 family putative permease subunit n=1 Tax=unclassified Actinomadura TaxID=2626254 RepID=UPI003A7FF95A